MGIKLSSKMQKEIPVSSMREYGYENKKEFVEDALRHWILELKKFEFLSEVRKIKEAMTVKGIEEKDILEDFEKFRHKK